MKRFLFLGHRWLGMALGVLFVMWFISGVVMMYVRMPILTPEERFSRLQPLDMNRVLISPEKAFAAAGLNEAPRRVRLGQILDRPVYYFTAKNQPWRGVYADDGTPVPTIKPEIGAQVAARFSPGGRPTFVETIDGIDQWTLTNSLNLHRPLHRYAMNDAEGTEIYVSVRTGEAVMRSTQTERALAWIGPIMHWLAPEALRKQQGLWRGLLMWLAFAGTLLALSGLIIGVIRYRCEGYALRDGVSRSPYRGMKRWHHWSGLVFGFVTLTWIWSGWLYTNPGGKQSGPHSTVTTFTPFNEGGIRADNSSKPQHIKALSGGDMSTRLFQTLPREAWKASDSPAPREVELVRFGGRPFYVFYADWNRSVTVAADGLNQTQTTLSLDELLTRVKNMIPDAHLTEATLLDTYDAYYYAVGNVAAKRLPILRVKFDEGTWFYINPHDGSIFRRYDSHGRTMRWLINGLHCLDFPFLMFNRPAWDGAILLLSLGGLVLSGSGVVMGWRRMRGQTSQKPSSQSKKRHSIPQHKVEEYLKETEEVEAEKVESEERELVNSR